MFKISKKISTVFIILIFVGIFKNANSEEKKLAPDIVAKDIYNNDFKLSKFKGKPIILQFMRVYCHGNIRYESIKQFKQLSNLYKKYYDEKNPKKSKIIFVTVTVSSCASSDLKKIAEENGIKWTFINDYSDYNLDIIKNYSEYLKNIPEPVLIFINKKFEIRNITSFCEDEILEKCVKIILGDK
jgi:peroxiredoxin